MDPLTLIVTAVTTGAAVGLKPVAEQAVKDAYAGLKQLVVDRYGHQGDVAPAVESVEAHSDEEWPKARLQEALGKTDAAKDEELLQAAQALLEAADPEGAKAGHYEVTATDHSVAVGGSVGRDVTITHTESDD